MNTLSNESRIPQQTASWTEVEEEDADQRIDNFLIRVLKGVPKTHLYRLLRTGQVRVNSRRVDATYRLRLGDRVRLPPVRRARPDRDQPQWAAPAHMRLSPHSLL
jgi:23S rRNA pseudouridine955/2504/2580 synthase